MPRYRGLEDALRTGNRDQGGAEMPHPDAPAPADEGRDSKPAHVLKARVLSGISISAAALVFGGFGLTGSPFGDLRLLVPFFAFQALSLTVALRYQPSDSRL